MKGCKMLSPELIERVKAGARRYQRRSRPDERSLFDEDLKLLEELNARAQSPYIAIRVNHSNCGSHTVTITVS